MTLHDQNYHKEVGVGDVTPQIVMQKNPVQAPSNLILYNLSISCIWLGFAIINTLLPLDIDVEQLPSMEGN